MTIIEPTSNFSVNRKPNKSEAVIMHPSENIIALKAASPNGQGNVLQVYNMAIKDKTIDITFNEKIIFWKWVNKNIIAIITPTSVYHV